MKRITYLIILSLVLFWSGCSDWLDVQPSERISAKKLFEEGDGFRNALNGIYQEASSQTLYGRELTWGLISIMAQDYNVNKLSYTYQYAAEYDFKSYESTKSIISNIWSKSYNLIANCNLLLNRIEKADTNIFEFKKMEKDLIKGETMAVRALIHFDLLRLFGPFPEDKAKIAIPYVNEYPNYYTPPKTGTEVLNYIIDDLNNAANLIAYNDTIVHRSQLLTGISGRFEGSYAAKNIFFNCKGYRINYVAIHALLARIYLYAGNKAKAFEHSEYLYNKYGPHSKNRNWQFTSETNSKGHNKYIKFADDIILAFYDPEIMTTIQDFFGSRRWTLSPDINIWFDKTKRDFRINLINDLKESEKWIESTSTQQYRKSQNFILPVIRMSEIYYIYSECLFETGDHQSAIKVLNQIRYARGRTDALKDLDKEAFYNELLMEYRREFIAEGQTFFTYKRLKRDIVTSLSVFKTDNRMIPPIPENETIF